MSNLSLTSSTSKEQAEVIFGYLIEEAEVKIKKLKDINVLNHIWTLAINRDNSKLKNILKSRAKELNVTLEG